MDEQSSTKAEAADKQQSIAALLAQPNAWSDWMGPSIPAYGSMRYAALMLRDVPVAAVVNVLAPALLKANAALAAKVVQELASGELAGSLEITFTEWLQTDWHSRSSIATQAVEEVLPRISLTADAKRFCADLKAADDYDSEAFLYFLMNAIQHWSFQDEGYVAVDPVARWLVEIEPCDGQDGLAALYAFLYKRFAADGHVKCEPLPVELEVVTEAERSLYFDDIQAVGSEVTMEQTIRITLNAGRPLLPQVLGIDSRMWRERAVLFEQVKRRHQGRSTG